MSILAGYCKTKTDENGKTYISGFFTKEFLKLNPQLDGMLPFLKYIPEEKRRSSKSPHWTLELFVPEEKNTAAEAEFIPL